MWAIQVDSDLAVVLSFGPDDESIMADIVRMMGNQVPPKLFADKFNSRLSIESQQSGVEAVESGGTDRLQESRRGHSGDNPVILFLEQNLDRLAGDFVAVEQHVDAVAGHVDF